MTAWRTLFVVFSLSLALFSGCTQKRADARLAFEEHIQSSDYDLPSSGTRSVLSIDQIDRTLDSIARSGDEANPVGKDNEAALPRPGATRSEWLALGGAAPLSGQSPRYGFSLLHSVQLAQGVHAKSGSVPGNSLCTELIDGYANAPGTDLTLERLSLLLLGRTLRAEESRALESMVRIAREEQDFARDPEVICAALIHHPDFLTY